MTPTQKLKWLVLATNAHSCGEEPPPYPCPNVDELWASAEERYELQDAISDVRGSGERTNLSSGHSRHYESRAVAAQLPDGTWVGWTYWYGGGKHGEPQSIPWMEDAYNVSMHEETQVVRVFTRQDDTTEAPRHD